MRRRASITFVAIAAALAVTAGRDLFVLPGALAQQPAAESPQGGDAADRMAQLEERIRDLQAVVGTLQSFVGEGGAAAAADALPQGAAEPSASGGVPSELSIRVLALETQIRAVTAQMKDVLERLDRMGAAPSAETPPWQQGENPPPPQERHGQPYPPSSGQEQSGSAEQFASAAQPAPQFGAAAGEPAPANPLAQQPPGAEQQTAQLPSFSGLSGSAGGARGIYDASYQSFVRNDFQGAEQGFRSFVETYPDDPLTGNAYYWLGRTHYERQQFEPAAKAFLAGYKRDKRGAIAPDSLLHLGLSLARLGEKEAACSTLGAIAKQYPEAPDKLREDATGAMKRARC